MAATASATTAADAGEPRTLARRLLIVISLASVFGPLNSTMVAVALPGIRSDFGVGVGALTLLVSAYLIATAVLQPASGRLGDAFGHLAMIQLGLAVLIATSLGAAFAWSFPVLVVMRSLQGAAAALTMPNVAAYLRKRIPAAELGSALGLNGAFISIGAAFGPVLGGALLAAGDWELLFLANVPLALMAFLALVRLDRDPGAGRAAFSLDWVSMATLTAVFAALTGLGVAIRSGQVALELGAVLVLVAAAAAYLGRYLQRGTGVLDLHLFTRRNYLVASFLVLLANLLMYTTLVAMPVYLSEVESYGDSTIGLLLFAMSAALVVISPLSGRSADRFGDRVLVVAGASVLLASVVGLTLAVDGWPLAGLAGSLLLLGLGMGLTQVPQQSAALKAWPAHVAGVAAGSFSLMRYTGSISGAALLAALLGDDVSRGDFRVVFLVLTALGIVNLAVSFTLRRS